MSNSIDHLMHGLLVSFLLFIILCIPFQKGFCQQRIETPIAAGDTVMVSFNALSRQQEVKINQVRFQQDSIRLDSAITAKRHEFEPRKATIRSAIFPGWGQVYNKKYWKLPIVYGALGVSAAVFFSNIKTYNQLRQAVILRRDTDPLNDTLIAPDLRPLSTESLTFYRNSFRQNIDYSVLAFLVLWGLNVVDATVDAHLKAFNVTPDLTLKIRPQYKFESNTAGLSFVFQLRKREHLISLP